MVSRPAGDLVVVTRFMVPEASEPDFIAGVGRLTAALAQRPGHLRTRLTQALDNARGWLLISEWEGVGAWRRALSAYDVRIEVLPLMAQADGEPAVFETRFDAPTSSLGD